MKPTAILLVKTESDGDFLSLNSQDLKVVQVDTAKETATLWTSSSKVKLACMTRHRMERLSKELRDRYNLFHLPSRSSATTNKPNTIVVVEDGPIKTYIWPKALFLVYRRGATTTLEVFGGMKLKVDSEVTANDFKSLDGFVQV